MDNHWDNNHDSDEFNDSDFFGDEPQESESPQENVEESPQQESETPKDKKDNEPEMTYFLWKDLEDMANFVEKFSEFSKREHELILSFLKNARITDPAFSIAKRLLEEESLSMLPMEIVEEAVGERMKTNQEESLPLTAVINLTTQISNLSIDSKHTLVKVANATLPGKPIQWRNNIPDNTLVTKVIENVCEIDPTDKGASPVQSFKAVQEVLKLWPGSRV